MKFLKFLFLFYTSALCGETLFALLLGDTSDPSLSVAVERDLKMMRQHTREVADYLGLGFAEVVFSGRALTKESFASLATLPIEPHDLLFFYWSGHGRGGEEELPVLQIGEGEEVLLEELIAHLKENNPRQMILLIDCCNRSVQECTISKEKEWSLKASKERLFSSLYLKERSVIILLSAAPGERALTSERQGSLFTRQYLAALSELMGEEDLPTWEALYERLREKCAPYGQTPVLISD